MKLAIPSHGVVSSCICPKYSCVILVQFVLHSKNFCLYAGQLLWRHSYLKPSKVCDECSFLAGVGNWWNLSWVVFAFAYIVYGTGICVLFVAFIMYLCFRWCYRMISQIRISINFRTLVWLLKPFTAEWTFLVFISCTYIKLLVDFCLFPYKSMF